MIEISKGLVGHLIEEHFPQWANLRIVSVKHSGHDNITFNFDDKIAVRLPSISDYVPQVEKEAIGFRF